MRVSWISGVRTKQDSPIRKLRCCDRPNPCESWATLSFCSNAASLRWLVNFAEKLWWSCKIARSCRTWQPLDGTDYRTSCSSSLNVKLYILHSLATIFFFFSCVNWAHLRKKPFNRFFGSIKLVKAFHNYVVLCFCCRYEWLQLYAHQLLRGDRGVVMWQVPSCQWASRRVGEQQGVSAGLHGAGQSAEKITQVSSSSSSSCRSITFSSSLRFTGGLRVWSKTRWPNKE